jgi:cyclic di-GMP phosphodiesterase Gmr
MTSMNDNKYSGASEAELGFLKEIVRMLPAGLTVQDAQGELLLVNDVAAAQLGMDGSRPSRDLASRLEACRQALSSGQAVVAE